MFTYADPVADDILVSSMPEGDVGELARHTQRLARQADARVVLLANRIGSDTWDRMERRDGRRLNVTAKLDKAAVGQVSLQLGISKSKANRWIRLGCLLADLPTVRIAFLAGDHSINRVMVIAESLCILDPQTRAQAEPFALTLAERPTTDSVLRDQLAELVITINPDGGGRRSRRLQRPQPKRPIPQRPTRPRHHRRLRTSRTRRLPAHRVSRLDRRTHMPA